MWIGLWRPGVALHKRLINGIQQPRETECREDGVPPAAVIVESAADRGTSKLPVMTNRRRETAGRPCTDVGSALHRCRECPAGGTFPSGTYPWEVHTRRERSTVWASSGGMDSAITPRSRSTKPERFWPDTRGPGAGAPASTALRALRS
jgi:hypothetical protein